MVYLWRTIRSALVMVTLFSASEVCAQVADVDITIDVNNTEATATLNIPDGVIEVLRLTAYDPDFVDEGQLFVNDQGPIDLFPGAANTNDGATVDVDIRLSDAQKAFFVTGNNTLRFTYVRTGGYGITRISAIGEVSVKEYAAIAPDMNGGDISANRTKALKIYKRLVGVTTPIDNPVLALMEQQIDAGDMLAAAKIASSEAGFLNNVVRDMAAKMSTREETVKTPLNDFTATIVGVVRDEVDSRTLLTGNYYYMGGPGAAVPSNLVEDLLSSNDHYATLENDGYDLSSVLTLVSGQQIRSGNGTAVAHPDPAGVLTSRAFMQAHATAGTNRRLVEFTMRSFTCNAMEDWSDASAPDIKVGRDVDRFPGGDGAKFQTTCKACHAQMDGMRGAFARFDFADGFTKYATLYNDGEGEDAMPQAPLGVSTKLNMNTDVFPAGHETLDDSWQNYARGPANQKLFGWRGTVASGAGVGQLGTAVSNSQAFSKCMVKRVFRELCRRDPANFELPAMESIANGFETQGYNLKLLFETVAVRPECAGL